MVLFGTWGTLDFWDFCGGVRFVLGFLVLTLVQQVFEIYTFRFRTASPYEPCRVFSVKKIPADSFQDSFSQVGAPIETQAVFCRPVVSF
jgi:hypothetical protein